MTPQDAVNVIYKVLQIDISNNETDEATEDQIDCVEAVDVLQKLVSDEHCRANQESQQFEFDVAFVDTFRYVFRASGGSAVYDDGMCELPTPDVEMLERMLHNVFKEYLPSYPDKATSTRCRWDCAYCKANDAGNA